MRHRAALQSGFERVRLAVRSRAAVDVRSLAAFRIGLGFVLLVDVLLRARDLTAFYTDHGVLPRATLVDLYPTVGHYSLHGLSGGVAWQALLFGLAAIAALALLVGYRTRLAGVVSLVLLLSLHARNPLVLNSGDTLLRQLLFWGLLLPIGSRWSVDATRTTDGPDRTASVATAALLVQVVIVYVANAAFKLRGTRWLEGTALESVFSLEQFTVLFGDVLAAYPGLLGVLGHAWLALLFASPLLLAFRGRTRGVLATAFVLGHLGMLLTLSLAVFPFVSIVGLLPFLPSELWSRLDRTVGSSIREWNASRPDRSGESKSGVTGDASAERDEPGRQESIRKTGRTIATVLAAIGLVVVLGYNAASLGLLDLPDNGENGVDLGGRHWSMFAPDPPSVDGWYVVPATLSSGERVDAFHRSSLSWDRPPDVSATYPNARWRKYLTRMHWRDDTRLRQAFAAYVCRQWNESHETTVEDLEIVFMAQPTRLDGPEPIERRTLSEHGCPVAGAT